MRLSLRLVTVALAAAMMIGLFSLATQPAEQSNAAMVKQVSQVNGYPVDSSADRQPDWIKDFEAGSDGVYGVDGEEVSSDSLKHNDSADSLLQAGDEGIFVGVLKPDPWRLDRCNGGLLAYVWPMSTTLEAELKNLDNTGYHHQALLGGVAAIDVITLADLEHVRAVAMNGYCGQAPPPNRFDEGVLEMANARGILSWPTFRPSGRRTYPLQVSPGPLENLFDAHEGYLIQIQGEYAGPQGTGYESMKNLDRVVFVEPGQEENKKNVQVLPIAFQKYEGPQIYIPFAERSPGGPSDLYRTPRPLSSGTPIPTLQIPPTATATPSIVAHAGAGIDPETGLDAQTAREAREHADAMQQAGAFMYAELIGYNGGIDLGDLRGIVTDDGAGPIITDTTRIEFAGRGYTDRIYGVTPSGYVRLSHPDHISPGRGAFMPKVAAAASNSNTLSFDVLTVVQTGETYVIKYGGGAGRQVLLNGAVVVGGRENDTYTIYVATSGPGWPDLTAGDMFGFAKIEVDVSDRARPVVREVAFVPLLSPAYEALLSQDSSLIHVLEHDGLLHTYDLDLNEVAQAVAMPAFVRPDDLENYLRVYRGVLSHLTSAKDGIHIAAGTGRRVSVQIGDLISRQAWLAQAPQLIDGGRYLGVAFNPFDEAPEILATHTNRQLRLLKPADGGTDWTRLEQFGNPFDLPLPAMSGPYDAFGGPQVAIGWVGPDTFVASWKQPARDGSSGQHKYEFAIIHVNLATGEMEVVGYLDLDYDPGSWPNDVVQCNGPLCNKPLPTATPTPTPTDTPTATLTPTATITPTPEPCTPVKLRADIVLVMDVSDSMRDSLENLKAAGKAFVGVMDQPNQISIVWFSNSAGTEPLTSDKQVLFARIDLLVKGSGTRIDLGLEAAGEELRSNRRLPGNDPVIVLMTDGGQGGDAHIRQADALKAAGVNIFTIGLGTVGADEAALRAIASRGQYYFAPDGAQLEAIYRQVARDIPCPTPQVPQHPAP